MGLPTATWISLFVVFGFVVLCSLSALPYFTKPEVLKKDIKYDN